MSAFRVVSGWSYFEDFTTATEAMLHAADRLREPTTDPLLREVRVLSLEEQGGIFPTVIVGERPLVQS